MAPSRTPNPDVVALMRAAEGAPALGTLPPAEMRVAYSDSRRALRAEVIPLGLVRDIAIPGPGGPLRLRLYRDAPEDAPVPCLLFLHGGGWVLGDLESHDAICRQLARASGGCVVAVDYRLAPEHPFPAAVEDAEAALRWAATAAPSIDAARIAVGGDSAGGNLAAVLAQSGGKGGLPRPMFQLLLYPATDLLMRSGSYRTMRDGLPLTSGAMRYFAGHYLPDAAQRADPRASPAETQDLAGQPPAFVLTCGHDPLCDEGRDYAARLEAAGVAVTALHLSDQAHGILSLGRAVGATAGILEFAGAALKEAWRHGGE